MKNNESKKGQHTPGPWEIDELLGNPGGDSYVFKTILRRNEDRSVFYIADVMGALSPYSEPNAWLISAAPELLEALEKAIRVIPSDNGMPTPLFNECFAAISKAKSPLANIPKGEGE